MSAKPEKRRTLRTQMGQFVMTPAWAIRRLRHSCQSSAEIATALHLYLTLGLYANTDKRAWPKTDQLAAALGPVDPETHASTPVGVRTIERAIFNLRRAGALQTEKRRNGHGHVIGLEYILLQVDPNTAETREQPATDGGLDDADNPPPQAGSPMRHSATPGGMDPADYPPPQAGSANAHSAAAGGLSKGLTANTDGDTPPVQAVRAPSGPYSELDPIELDPKAAAAAATYDTYEQREQHEAQVRDGLRDAFRCAWNDAIVDTPLIPVDDLTPARAALIDQALNDRPLADWTLIFGRVAKSSFCCGGGQQGWIADLWWLLRKPEAALSVMEGKYDDHYSDAELAEAGRRMFNVTGGRCPFHPITCADRKACVRRYALQIRWTGKAAS